MYTKNIVLCQYASPLGNLVLGDHNGKLCLCDWISSKKYRRHLKNIEQQTASAVMEGTSPLLQQTIDELNEYFNGRLHTFNSPLAVYGTPFQKRVWNALDKIPYGRTTTYSALAKELGIPKSIRAVAGAVANNPLSIVRPCHRVVGQGGQLTGYAGGLEAKRGLLRIEGIM